MPQPHEHAKQDIKILLNHLDIVDKVRCGLEYARVNGTLSQNEVESRLSKWLTE